MASRQAIIWNQCWDIINWALKNKPQWSCNRISYIFVQLNAFQIIFCEMAAIFPGLYTLNDRHRRQHNYVPIYQIIAKQKKSVNTIKKIVLYALTTGRSVRAIRPWYHHIVWCFGMNCIQNMLISFQSLATRVCVRQIDPHWFKLLPV